MKGKHAAQTARKEAEDLRAELAAVKASYDEQIEIVAAERDNAVAQFKSLRREFERAVKSASEDIIKALRLEYATATEESAAAQRLAVSALIDAVLGSEESNVYSGDKVRDLWVEDVYSAIYAALPKFGLKVADFKILQHERKRR